MPPQLVQLVLPGLLWPRPLLHETAADLDLPALSWLLGRARLQWQAGQSPEAALCALFEIPPRSLSDAPSENSGNSSEYPFAALRRLGEVNFSNPVKEENFWLCADPVHLHVEKRRMTLPTQTSPATDEEMQAIAAALHAHFQAETDSPPPIFTFHPATQGRAYLRLKHCPAIATAPPSAAIGYDAMLPQGPDAQIWRRLVNEMQMVLHALPFNEQREQEGKPRLNALWLWGAGALPPPPQHRSFTAAYSGRSPGALLHGLARWSDISASILTPTSFAMLTSSAHERILLLLDTLQQPARQFDALDWREALVKLEREWLEPLQQAFMKGSIKNLHLFIPGDEASLSLELEPFSRLAFWRRPCPLSRLPLHEMPS